MTVATPAGAAPTAAPSPPSAWASPTWPSPTPLAAPLSPDWEDSAGASGTVVGFLGQPARTRVQAAISRTGNQRIVRAPLCVIRLVTGRVLLTQATAARHAGSVEKRRPGGLAHFAGARSEALLDASVARDDREHAASAL